MDVKNLFMKQKMMRTVLLALIPVALMAVFLNGWRVVMLAVIVALAAVIAEYLVMHTINKEKTKVSEAVFVSAALFTLSLPPRTPIWIALVGIIFGVVFGKTVFGGFGRNIFNPALVGRCFIYIAFPTQMTLQWERPFLALPGGFAAWMPAADTVTSATPIISFNTTGALTPLGDLFLGFTNGSLGETSALIIILCGIFLAVKKVASWRLMVSTVVSGGVFSALLYYLGAAGAGGRELAPPLFALLSGGFLFSAVFMVTDPISAPKDKVSQVIAGTLVGIVTVVIRSFALFTEGIMFAILIVNALTPLIELKVKQFQDRGKKPAKEAAA